MSILNQKRKIEKKTEQTIEPQREPSSENMSDESFESFKNDKLLSPPAFLDKNIQLTRRSNKLIRERLAGKIYAVEEISTMYPYVSLFGATKPKEYSLSLGEKNFHQELDCLTNHCYLAAISYFAGADVFAYPHNFNRITSAYRKRSLTDLVVE